MVTITQKGDEVLRQIAHEVPVEDIETEKIQNVIRDMQQALDTQEDGVAIAAPQIGVPLRIFIVSKRVSILDDDGRLLPHMKPEDASNYRDHVFINPKIVNTSSKKHWVSEGCLSVRGIYGKTHRHVKATVQAYDIHGKKFTRGGSGLLAQIYQHETDHLNGILFDDHAKDIEPYQPPEKSPDSN